MMRSRARSLLLSIVVCAVAPVALPAQATTGSVVMEQPPAPTPTPAPTPALPRLVLEPSVEKAAIGDRVELSIASEIQAAWESVVATRPSDLPNNVLIESAEKRDGRWRIVVRPLIDGPQVIGPLRIEATGATGDKATFESMPFELNIETVPTADPTAVATFTDPERLPYNWLWRNLAYGAAGALALMAIAAAGFWLASRRRAPKPVRIITPLEEAQLALKTLSSLALFDAEGPEAYYTALSNALRRYLESDLKAPVLEMSDDEVRSLLTRELSMRAGAPALGELFARAGMAKFARESLSREIASTDCSVAQLFLEAEAARLRALRALEEHRRATQVPPGAAPTAEARS